MKLQPKPRHRQLKLALQNHAPVALPVDKDRELALALVDLLVNAAVCESADALATQGGPDDPEVDE